MRIHSVILTLSTLLRTGFATLFHVGISLSSGYATASALDENEEYVDIAKIEGNARYKAYMLGSREGSHTMFEAIKYCPFPQRVCQHSWPWKADTKPHNPLASIVQALVVAAESTLGTSILTATVSISDLHTVDFERADRDVQSALLDVHVYSAFRLNFVPQQLIFALGLEGRCSDSHIRPEDPSYQNDPTKLILNVEYTRQSLIATLWEDDCGAVAQLAQVHSTASGHDALGTCRRANRDNTSCDEAFKATLRNLNNSQKWMSKTNQTVDAVFVIGEQAIDVDMLTLLREVLTERFINGETVDLTLARSLAPDATYVGSRTMAWMKADANSRVTGIAFDQYQDTGLREL